MINKLAGFELGMHVCTLTSCIIIHKEQTLWALITCSQEVTIATPPIPMLRLGVWFTYYSCQLNCNLFSNVIELLTDYTPSVKAIVTYTHTK